MPALALAGADEATVHATELAICDWIRTGRARTRDRNAEHAVTELDQRLHAITVSA